MRLYTLLFILFLLPLTGYSQLNRLKEGDVLYQKYHYIDAQKVYEEVVAKGYKSAQIYGDLADSYYYQSNYDKAIIWYDLLFKEFPDKITDRYYLRTIQSLKSTQQYDRADELLTTYTSKFGRSSVTKHYDADPDYLKGIQNMPTEYDIEWLGINGADSDHGVSFLGDSKIVFASSSTEEGKEKHKWNQAGFLDLFIADRDTINGRPRNKQTLKGNINSDLHESTPVFTKDGKTMYFTRNNIDKGERIKDNTDVIRLRIFKAELQSDDYWKIVEDLPINSDDYSTAYPALNSAEDKLYFSSDRLGSLGMSDIWFINLYPDGSYGYPVRLGDAINTEGREAFLFIDKKDVLYFSSDGHLGLGGLDIFKTKLNKRGLPTRIKNIGAPFNSPRDDFGFIIDSDKNNGYFSTNREDQGVLGDNIYYFFPKCKVEVQGQLNALVARRPLNGGKIQVLNDFNEVIYEELTRANGKYRFEAECDTGYLLKVSKEGYLSQEVTLYTPETTDLVIQDFDLVETLSLLFSDDLGEILSLRPIYFDFGGYTISKESEIELSKIAEAMRLYPNLMLHIESHTDSRGSAAFNLGLSELRAKATLDWLITQGEIEAHRLTSEGYGESRLINECADGAKCDEEEHLLNRRSNFIIIQD